jgi:hypothetical protein
MHEKEAPVRITISAVAIALISILGARPAHALFGAVGWLGYGHVFQDGEDSSLGPTLELGPSLSVPFIAVDLTYWTDLDDAGEASQLRIGGRIKPPLAPVYGRLALGLPLDGDTRDVLGTDIIFGAGFEALSLPLVKLNVELDYHYWTDGPEGISIHPFEAKVGVAIGF